MKKQILIATAVLFSAGTILLTGCKKDDTTPPVVTLAGSDPMSISLNASLPADPGATAEDDEDGDLTASISSDWATVVNTNLKGSYTVTYSVVDAAGNEGTATRTVNVVNDAEQWAGTYAKGSIVDSVYSDAAYTAFVQTYAWTTDLTVVASSTVNNKITMSPFLDYTNIAANQTVYGNVVGTTLTIPSQICNNVGSPATNHTFQGNGYIAGTSPFSFRIFTSDMTSSGTAYDKIKFVK